MESREQARFEAVVGGLSLKASCSCGYETLLRKAKQRASRKRQLMIITTHSAPRLVDRIEAFIDAAVCYVRASRV